jgi:copper chaperone CopZ
MKFGLMIMFVLMMGMMIVMAMTSSGSGGWGSGVWAMIVFPFFGLLIMLIMMFFFFRRMSSSGGPMSRMMGHSHAMPSQGKENTLTYNIPAVNCMHCKMTIEREVGELSGVDSVSVDVETKQAVIKFDPPSTKAEIEALLTKIGYPPESQ